MFNYLYALKTVRVVTAQAISTGINGDSVDMRGFDSVAFVAAFGALSGAAVLKAQQSSDDGSSDAFADLEGSGVDLTGTDDDGLAILEVVRPCERYVRPVITGEAADEVDCVLAILFNAKSEPVTHDDTVAATGLVVSPDEGTA